MEPAQSDDQTREMSPQMKGETVEIKRIENETHRRVTLRKRRSDLLKKAREFSTRFDAEVALIVFSSSGRLCDYASNSVDATIERYNRASYDPSNDGPVIEGNAAYFQQEASKLQAQISELEVRNRNMLGQSLGDLSLRDLKKVQYSVEKGIRRIRSKKKELLFAEAEDMHKKLGIDLHYNSHDLRAKIAEYESDARGV